MDRGGSLTVTEPPIRVGLVAPRPEVGEDAAMHLRAAGIEVLEGAALDAVDPTPDCIVVLTLLPAEDDLAAAAERFPGAGLVTCGPAGGAGDIRRAIEHGADGVVWDDEAGRTLAATVRAVAAGQVAVPRLVWRRIERPELTTREKQTLGLVIMGLTNGEIAQRLYVSESTVKSHLSSSFRKLGVRSRAEAARVIADPREGLGTGILEITGTSSSGRTSAPA